MAVLIKGMEMPENCDVCFMRDSCEYSMPVGKRLSECPLIEVPTPHGRLINADAIQEEWYRLNFDRKISDGTLAYWNFLLSKAPTILEAEEGET